MGEVRADRDDADHVDAGGEPRRIRRHPYDAAHMVYSDRGDADGEPGTIRCHTYNAAHMVRSDRGDAAGEPGTIRRQTACVLEVGWRRMVPGSPAASPRSERTIWAASYGWRRILLGSPPASTWSASARRHHRGRRALHPCDTAPVSHGCHRLLPDGRSTTGIPVRVRRSRSSCRARCPLLHN